MAKHKADIYVDGSYNTNTHKIGCAVVIFIESIKRPYRNAYNKQLKSQKEYGSNIAEMSAVKTAIKTAHSLGITHINIYHDWTGVELFSHSENIKERHRSCPSFTTYANYVEKVRKTMIINFIKVKAHSDNELNCLVDRMARAGRTI